MRVVIAKPGCVIPLGRLGENEATTVVFDVKMWQELFGDGVVSLVNMRSGDAAAYPCTIECDGNLIRWTTASADLAMEGYGRCELIYTVGQTVVKSYIYTTFVDEALTGGGDVPEPWEDWVQRVIEAGTQAQAAAASASADADRAETSAEAAEQSAQEAERAAGEAATETAELIREEMQGYVTDAENAKTAAETAKTGAQNAQTAAESARDTAQTAAQSASTSATAADTAQTAAEAAQTAAETAEGNAEQYASTATTKAAEAATSEQNAFNYQQGSKEYRDETEAMLDDLVKYDNDEFASPLPFNADQLNGHPDTYFAKQEDMSAAEADIAENSRDIASLKAATSNLSTSKVDKENGKGLSTNDFTDVYKQNVDANTSARHTHGNKAVLDMITQAMLDLIATITGKYVKPNGGIPKSDLDSGVQASLGKADTALQEHQSLSAYRTAEQQDEIDDQKYSASNLPPYPVTSVNGQTGGVVLNYITYDEEEE